jgi:cellulose synthase/poly-beta-1,6-N-acetylglucosamine synthase-like glycosyltransferase
MHGERRFRGRCVRRTANLSHAVASALVAYDLVLLCAARQALTRRERADLNSGSKCGHAEVTRIAVVIPAHNASQEVGTAITSVHRADEWAGWNTAATVIVVAHNCTDDTSFQASAMGARVIEVADDGLGGKAAALRAAFGAILRDGCSGVDALFVMDADCRMSANCLSALADELCAGARVVQVENRIGNPQSSASAALRFASFAMNTLVEPLGLFGLGGSSTLTGTGMGFRPEVLRENPFASESLAEDRDYYLALVQSGERIRFVPGAWVSSDAPTTFQASMEQQLRWETGNRATGRTVVWKTLKAGIDTRSGSMLLAGGNALMPGQLPCAGLVCTAGIAFAASRPRSFSVVILAAAPAFGFGVFAVGALQLAGAPRDVYKALRYLPRAAVAKARLSARITVGRGVTRW